MNEKRIDDIVDAYISSLDEHETPGILEVKRALDNDPAKGISATSRAELSNFVKEALFKKLISKHKWPNKTPPLGYKVDKNQNISIHKTNARCVRWIFKKYLETGAISDVAYYYNKKYDKQKNSHSMYYILKNEIYLGIYNVSGEVAYIPELQIINEKQFLEVQQSIKNYKNRKRPMNSEVKREKIDKVFNAYMKSLDDTSDESLDEKIETEKPRKPVNKRKRAETLEYESEFLTKLVGDITGKERIKEVVDIGIGNVDCILKDMAEIKKLVIKAKNDSKKNIANRHLNRAIETLDDLLFDLKIVRTNFEVLTNLEV